LNWLDAQAIIDSFGDWAVLAVAFIIFIETAFIFTSFLPGDSLLFIIGLTLSVGNGIIPDWAGFLLVWLAAFGGTQLGWFVGYKIGPPLFERRENFIFNKKVVAKTKEFFDKYGVRAIVLARFVPIVRALVPMLAGISKMEVKRFAKLNAIGATLWVGLFMLSGYLLGEVTLVKDNLEASLLIVVILSALPLPVELLRARLINRRQQKNPAD
jgi:membrane-associated protein